MATVTIQTRKRQNRSSYLIYYKEPYTGKKKYYKTFQRKTDAQKEANNLRYLPDSGKLPAPKQKQVQLLSFNDVADRLENKWQEDLQTKRLKPASARCYRDFLKATREVFGQRILCHISKKEITDYCTEVARMLSNVSSNRRLVIIKKIFRCALEMNAALEDPSKDIRYLSEKAHERSRFILPNELNRLVEAASKTRAKYYMPALIYLGAEHGTSRQEALSLCWSDINFDYEDIGLIQFYRTKNDRLRTEYLMPRSKEALLSWQEHQKLMRHRKKVLPKNSDYVFSHMDGKPLQSFKTAWNVICKIADLSDLHYHDLRHTFCSNLILSGADLKEVKEMIGHADIAMTDRYAHLTSKHKLSRQQQLARHYSEP